MEAVELSGDPEALPGVAGACCWTIVRSAGEVVGAVWGAWLSGLLSPLEPFAAVTGGDALFSSLSPDSDVPPKLLCLASWSVDVDALTARLGEVAPEPVLAFAEDVPEISRDASPAAAREPATPLVITGPLPPEEEEAPPAFPVFGMSAPPGPEFPVPVGAASASAAAVGPARSAAASADDVASSATEASASAAVPAPGEPTGKYDLGGPPFSACPLPKAVSLTELPEAEPAPLIPGASPSGSEAWFCTAAPENCLRPAMLSAAAISVSTGDACGDPSPWLEEPLAWAS